MNQQECTQLLEQHDIRPTANRIVILKTLADSGRPLTLTELEYRILSIDKSGVSRALTLFREHHLVHVIEDGNGSVRYELCHSHDMQTDDDLHVHFFCECCHRTYCLEHTPIPRVSLPAHFQMISATYMVKGICDDCHRQKGG